MRRFGVMSLGVAVLLVSCNKMGKNIELKTDKQKISYAIGQQIGQGMKMQGIDVDPDVVSMSIGHVLAGKDSKMTQDEIRQTMQKMNEQMRQKRVTEAKENKEKGKKFLEDNKKKEGVKTTKSGLQYKVLKAGTGKKPKPTDKVRVHYKGTLTDGTEFDSSYKRKQPAEFPLNGVIKGWTEALTLMKKGAKWQLFIPGDLGYGAMGGPNIPPNSVLVFEVELLEIL